MDVDDEIYSGNTALEAPQVTTTPPEPVEMLNPASEPQKEDSGPEGAADAVPEFDPQVREPFTGLLFLGALTDEFTYAGHRFRIKTLDTDANLAVGLLHRDYQGSLGDLKAYQTLMNAACVTAVDGRPLYTPLQEMEYQDELRERFKVAVRWYPPIQDAIYDEYLRLEVEQARALEAMGKARG